MSRMKEGVLRVLDSYKHMPCLWDKTHIDYKNKNSRYEAQNILLGVYKEYDKYATAKSLTKKIQNLRTGYVKELRKVKESAFKGGMPYAPTLYYYDALSFLENVVTSETLPEETEVMETEYLSDDHWTYSDAESDHNTSQASNTTPAKRIKILRVDSIKKEDEVEVSEKYKMKDEDWDILGKSIGLQLRNLEKKQLTIAQKIISDAIYYGNMGLLSERSFIALHQPDDQCGTELASTTYPHFVPLAKSGQSSHSVSSSTPKSDEPSQMPQHLDDLLKNEPQRHLVIEFDDQIH